MRKEKLIPFVSLVVVILSVLLAACSEDMPEPTSMPPPEETADVETPELELTVTPEDDEEEETLTPQPSELTAVIVSGDSAGAGKPFTFDATQSQSGEHGIVDYVWVMGDGTILFGLAIEHAYDEPGFYTVTLTITGEDGHTDTTAKVVEVIDLEEEVPPTEVTEFTLVSTNWVMDNAVRGTTITLEFDEESLSGSSGCNSYTAIYTATLAGEFIYSISVSSITGSGQICTLEIMSQEQGFLESLASASNVTIDGETLLLQTGSGMLTFSLASN